jgi:hypothetical protein
MKYRWLGQYTFILHKLHNKNIEIGNSQVNDIFSCHPFSPHANKYLHMDQINLQLGQKRFAILPKLFCLKTNQV